MRLAGGGLTPAGGAVERRRQVNLIQQDSMGVVGKWLLSVDRKAGKRLKQCLALFRAFYFAVVRYGTRAHALLLLLYDMPGFMREVLFLPRPDVDVGALFFVRLVVWFWVEFFV